jgi:hypothetical protein
MGAKRLMDLPKDFFTPASMFTFAGATTAVFVVVNGLQQAFDWRPRWLGLIVAQIVVNGGVYASGGNGLVNYGVGVVNGFLVFLAAGGATGALASAVPGSVTIQSVSSAKPHRGFLGPWF